MKPIEFIRCPLRFDIMGIIFRCDLQDGHSGQCISLPDEPRKIATVMWPRWGGSDGDGMKMTMTKIELDEKNFKVLNSILENGLTYLNDNEQPVNINQVISQLIDLAYNYNDLHNKTINILLERD